MKLLTAQVLDHFGGDKERFGKGKWVFYRVGDGKLLNIKYSRRHGDYYWFGLHASLWEEAAKAGVTPFVFILLPDAFAAVPVGVMREYIAEAGISPKSDKTVRHYHVLVSADAKPALFHHGKANRIPLKPYCTRFDG